MNRVPEDSESLNGVAHRPRGLAPTGLDGKTSVRPDLHAYVGPWVCSHAADSPTLVSIRDAIETVPRTQINHTTFARPDETLGKFYHRGYMMIGIVASFGVCGSEPLGSAWRGPMAVPPPGLRPDDSV